ncbi:glycosyltransferase family 4 protein [Roseibacterium sp. KMU-115]|uniref:Glycosyltransferase family 4 protein n=1 Tax=Roseicyclus persicicus TaxID=2650661 RepID=A0A7X6JZS8_9RHOB|nr:glycosyltransferase family 4 protein [Roseibacterium persicicum]
MTRLVTRAGRGVLTGIDRVELAYLRHLLAADAPDTRYLLRSTRGHLLLDRRGGARLADLAAGGALPARGDLLSRLIGKGSNPRHRVESALRPVAVDRCLPSGLPRMLRRSGGALTYLNTGHANLSEATLGALGADPRVRVAVLIHDLIPIAHPDLVAEDMPARFAGRLGWVRAHADLVICNSAATAAELSAHWGDGAPRPPAVVAPLGLDPAPRGAGPRDPLHFVMLGTIEPRKNHALILAVWERLAEALPADRMPNLHVIGPTGWRVEALMARLARHPLTGRSIHLHGALPEAAVQDHLARAVALLFPSLAEGYGYPPLEAALAGALPICSDLPVFRETLGKSAVYLDGTDAYPWLETIKKHVLGTEVLPTLPAPVAPRWGAHFDTVGPALGSIERKGPE